MIVLFFGRRLPDKNYTTASSAVGRYVSSSPAESVVRDAAYLRPKHRSPPGKLLTKLTNADGSINASDAPDVIGELYAFSLGQN